MQRVGNFNETPSITRNALFVTHSVTSIAEKAFKHMNRPVLGVSMGTFLEKIVHPDNIDIFLNFEIAPTGVMFF